MPIKEKVVEAEIHKLLAAQGKTPRPLKKMLDHHFDPPETEFGGFLNELRKRLRPEYEFKYDNKFLKEQLEATLVGFVMAVDKNTTEISS